MEEVVKMLIKLNKTISTMESCTGGGLANAITNIPDSSKVIKFSAVTYSNEFKERMGVDGYIINKYSVYSMETAESMAYNISLFTGSDFGVGITGKLGRPDENNLSGNDSTVYISLYDKENDEFYDKIVQVVHDNRKDNKDQVIDECENLIYVVLSRKKKSVTM